MLGFVEPVDLIDEQNRARGVQGPPLLGPGDHLLEISDPRGDRVDLLDLRTGRLRDDVGERGLPRPWWAVQDERRKVIAFDGPAQQASRAYQVLLAHEFVQRPWPHSGRQRRLCRDLPGGALLKQLHGLLLARDDWPAASMVAYGDPQEPGASKDRAWTGKSCSRRAEEAGNSRLARKFRNRTNSTLPQEGSQWPNR